MNSGQGGLCHAAVGSGRRLCAPRLRRNTPATSVEGTLKPREDCSCDCVVRGVFERARAPRRAQNCMLLPLRPQPPRSARKPSVQEPPRAPERCAFRRSFSRNNLCADVRTHTSARIISHPSIPARTQGPSGQNGGWMSTPPIPTHKKKPQRTSCKAAQYDYLNQLCWQQNCLCLTSAYPKQQE